MKQDGFGETKYLCAKSLKGLMHWANPADSGAGAP